MQVVSGALRPAGFENRRAEVFFKPCRSISRACLRMKFASGGSSALKCWPVGIGHS